MGASTHSKSRHGTMNSSGGSKVVQFKLVLLGDSAVGKSSLVLRFVRGQFFEYQESTIGAAFLTQNVSLNDYTVKFEIWDTACQERYHSLAPMYYRGAAVALVFYSRNCRDDFRMAQRWIMELRRNLCRRTVIILVATVRPGHATCVTMAEAGCSLLSKV